MPSEVLQRDFRRQFFVIMQKIPVLKICYCVNSIDFTLFLL